MSKNSCIDSLDHMDIEMECPETWNKCLYQNTQNSEQC